MRCPVGLWLILAALVLPGSVVRAQSTSDEVDAANWQAFLRALASSGDRQENFYRIVESGNVDTVRFAISKGAKVNQKRELQDGIGDSMLWTPLMWASCRNPDADVIRALVKAGASINVADKFGKTALIIAAGANQSDPVISALIEQGADVNAFDYAGRTVLMYAAESSQDPMVIETIVTGGARIDARAGNGFTALMYAALSNKEAIVLELLALGADKSLLDNGGGTAYYWASTYNPNSTKRMLDELRP